MNGPIRHINCLGLTLRLLNALNSEDRGLKVRFSLATIVFETFELILCQMLSSQGKNAPSHPYPHYVVRLAASRNFPITHTSVTQINCFRIICVIISGLIVFRLFPNKHHIHKQILGRSIVGSLHNFHVVHCASGNSP